MTANKRRILEALRAPESEHERIERTMPPYSASSVARWLQLDMNNVARTLRNMARDGLVIPDVQWVDVWADGLKSTRGRSGLVRKQLTCYWCADTLEADCAAVAEWEAGREERCNAVLDKLARL
jgi:hypothetical protein